MPANIQQRPEPIALGNQPLTLEWVLGQLIADGLVTAENAKPLQQVSTARKKPVHPLLVIAEKKWPDPEKHSKPLTLERLTEWLAAKTDIEYRHIDPFKIEFASVTKLISNAYATRFRILPLSVNATEAVFATCEPFVRDWEDELAKVLRVKIKRVLANPRDIDNYLVEFYNLANSVQGGEQGTWCKPFRHCQLRTTRPARAKRQS